MKIERLMYIIILLVSKKHLLAREVADIFGVSTRTIYRDMDTLSLLGIPIYTERGNKGGYYLAESYQLDSFLLSEEEQTIILNMSRSLSQLAEMPKIDLLYEKMKLLSPTAKETFFLDFSLWETGNHSFEKIERAIEQALMISFNYTSYTNAETLRQIEPITIVFKSQNWYLYGFCQTRRDFRLFRLSRIRQLKVLDAHFDDSKYQSIDANTINQILPNLERITKVESVVLIFSHKVKAKVYDTFSEEFIEQDNNQLIVRKKMPIDEWFLGLILSFKGDVKVLQPLELKESVKKAALDILAQYDST